MPSELLWASLETQSNFQTPPKWVAKAIGKSAAQAVEQIQNIPGMLLGTLPLAKVGEIAGQMSVDTAYLQSPGADVEEVEKLVPELKSQRENLLKIADKCESDLANSKILKKRELNHQETSDYLGGQGQGAQQAAKELATEATLTTQICSMMWVLWRDVDQFMDRPPLHDWLQGTLKISCSFKLVERICDEIGFRPARRGRPKNPTAQEKTVGIRK